MSAGSISIVDKMIITTTTRSTFIRMQRSAAYSCFRESMTDEMSIVV